MRLSEWRRRCRAEWKLCLLALLLVPLLLALGCWQLMRAEQKAHWLAQQRQAAQQPPLPLEQLALQDLERWTGRRVRIEGQWRPEHTLLLDNQVVNGRVGYDVVTPVRLRSGALLLVNRGWLAAMPRRTQRPPIPAVSGAARLIAELHVPAGKAFTLGATPLAPGWPKVVQRLDHAQLQPLFAAPLLPYSVRLRDASAGALTPHWNQTLRLGPERHRGYAVQWFALALTLLVLTLVAVWRRPLAVREREESA